MLVNGSGVLSGLALEHRSDSHDGLTVSKASDLDPGRVSALNGYLVRLHPDDIAARREHQNLVLFTDAERSHNVASDGGDLHTPDPLPATPLPGKKIQLGPLAVSARRDEQHDCARAIDVTRHHGIPRPQAHAPDAPGGPAHRTHARLREPDGLTLGRDHDHVILAGRLNDPDQ